MRIHQNLVEHVTKTNVDLLFTFILDGKNNNVVKTMLVLQENLILNQIAL